MSLATRPHPRPTAGSSTLWVYSTLLLQLSVPNALLGRMSALDMAFSPA
jgi:hypothetical protein